MSESVDTPHIFLWTLAQAISNMQDSIGEVSVTLVLGGSVIEGELVSHRVWLDGLAAQLAEMPQDTGPLVDNLTDMAGLAANATPEKRDPNRLCLRSANLTTGGEPQVVGKYFTVDLRSVDAFMLGRRGSGTA